MACDTIKIETLDADEVVSIVTQGPQGPSGAEAATLTTTGDILYRAPLANARLPIGSEGQILKVSSGLPAWGNESDAVTSVNGETGAVVLDAADVGAANASHTHAAADITSGTLDIARIPTGTSSSTVCIGDDARLSDARTPTSHTHGNITNAGLVGTTANLPLKTGTGGIVEAGAFGTGAGEFAEGNHTHELTALAATGATNGHVLTAQGDGTAAFAAASGGVSAVGASTADVLSVSGSDLVADDGGTIDSADPFIKWDDVAGKLVYANPLSRPSGAFYVGLAPTTTALGTDALTIQANRAVNANRLASGLNAISIGNSTRASAEGGIAIGQRADSSDFYATAIGQECVATADDCVAIGGYSARASANNAVAIGRQTTADLRSMFSTRPFNAVYWSGQTTTNAATVLNLDGAATNRFTIAASTALAVDILLVARRSDTADKWLVARRFLGIRRDGSNNTSLIGSVQTLGTDQSDGSPSWTFALTADDTNEALQLEVTGAASETVQWRATAFYRVV